MHARFYSPLLGRFLSVDPEGYDLTKPQSWNRYAYVLNNPVNLTDPTGRCVEDLCIGEGYAAYLAGAAAVSATVGWLDSPSGGDPSRTNAQIIGGGLAALGNAIGNVFRSDTNDADSKPKPGSAGGPGAGKDFSDKTKNDTRAKSGDACVFCGGKTTREPGPKQSNIDHAQAKAKGGNNTPENAQNTCRTCNLQKGTKSTSEFLKWLADRLKI